MSLEEVVEDRPTVNALEEVVEARKPVKAIVKEPIYHRGKLIGYRIVGHGFVLLVIGGVAVSIFFPSATVLLINNVNPVGVMFISTFNVIGKFALGYRGLMYPVVESASHLAAQENRDPFTRTDGIKMTVIVIGSYPVISVFTLGTLASIETFQAQVANHTLTNATALPEIFYQVANATMIPAFTGVLLGCSGAFNLIGNIWVALGSVIIVNGMKKEYELIVFDVSLSELQMLKKIRRYQIGMWSGASVFLVAGIWGNIVYFPFAAELYHYYMQAPYGVGYSMGALVFFNMLLLAFLCIVPLVKRIAEFIFDLHSGDFDWRQNKTLLLINTFNALLTLGIISMGSLYSVFNAIYSMLNLPTVVASGILGGLVEISSVFQMCEAIEEGVAYLLCCGWKKDPSIQEQWESNQHEVSPSKKPHSSTDGDFSRSQTPESSEGDSGEAKTVSWGQWFGSFFKCCDGSRGKNNLPTKRNSASPLLPHPTEPSQEQGANVTSPSPLYQGGMV